MKLAIQDVPSRASPAMRKTRGIDAISGLNGLVSQPRNPHTMVVWSAPPPSRRAVVVAVAAIAGGIGPCPFTLIENGSCAGLGAKKIPGSRALTRRPGALEMTW